MGELSITVIDVLIVGVVLVSAAFAMWRGLVHETFSIFEWVAGIIVALRLAPVFRPLLKGVISSPELQYGAVFLGTFLLVFIPLSILSNRLSEAVKKSEIGPVDRALGLVFGIARGLVIVGLSYIAFSALVPVPDHPTALTHARLFGLVQSTSDVLLDLVPGIEGKKRDANAGVPQPSRAQAPPVNRSAASSRETTANTSKTYGASDRRALDNLIQTTGRESSQ